jgi:hypothetical protein
LRNALAHRVNLDEAREQPLAHFGEELFRP